MPRKITKRGPVSSPSVFLREKRNVFRLSLSLPLERINFRLMKIDERQWFRNEIVSRLDHRLHARKLTRRKERMGITRRVRLEESALRLRSGGNDKKMIQLEANELSPTFEESSTEFSKSRVFDRKLEINLPARACILAIRANFRSG